MSLLYSKVSENPNLRYVDDNTGKEYTLAGLPDVQVGESEKGVAFLYLDNSLTSIAVFWSFMKSNQVIALLSPTLTPAFKDDLEALYKPLYVYDPSRNHISGYEYAGGSEEIRIWKRATAEHVAIDERIKLLITTSGTTGSPKFVKLSEKNLLANANSICSYLPVNGEDVTPLNLPVYYSYGLSVLTTNSLKGGKVVCSNIDILNGAFWERLEKYGYTSIAGVPYLYEMLERIGFRKKQYPSLKYFTQAGGKLQEPLVKKFGEYAAEYGIQFFVMYGQTEATARMSYVPADELLNKVGSIGKPIKDGSFVIDAETNELCYKGPNVFGGYVNGPQDLATYEQLEHLNTGDIARVDDDGYYYITGRLKRFVKLFGTRVNLDEVETIAYNHFGKVVKCFGVNDKVMVMSVLAGSIEGAELVSFIADQTKIHPSVLKAMNVEEYPLTQNGKVNYTELSAIYQAGK